MNGFVIVVFVMRSCGLAPYTLDKTGQYTSSRTWRILSAAMLFTVNVAGCTFLMLLDNNFSVVTVTAYWIMKIILALETVLSLWCQLGRLHPTLRSILNAEAVRGGVPFVSLVPAALAVVAMCLCHLTSITINGLMVYEGRRELLAIVKLGSIGYFFYKSVCTTFFAYLMYCISAHFESMNVLLGTLVSSKRVEGYRRGAGDVCLVRALAGVRIKHLNASATLVTLCWCFGPYTIANGLMDFWELVLCSFSCIGTDPPLLGKVALSCVIVSIIVRWLYVVIAAAQVVSKGNQTLRIIHSALNHCKLAVAEKDELQMFAQILQQAPVRVPLLFDLDLNIGLVFQTITAAITYLIILLQFAN